MRPKGHLPHPSASLKLWASVLLSTYCMPGAALTIPCLPSHWIPITTASKSIICIFSSFGNWDLERLCTHGQKSQSWALSHMNWFPNPCSYSLTVLPPGATCSRTWQSNKSSLHGLTQPLTSLTQYPCHVMGVIIPIVQPGDSLLRPPPSPPSLSLHLKMCIYPLHGIHSPPISVFSLSL